MMTVSVNVLYVTQRRIIGFEKWQDFGSSFDKSNARKNWKYLNDTAKGTNGYTAEYRLVKRTVNDELIESEPSAIECVHRTTTVHILQGGHVGGTRVELCRDCGAYRFDSGSWSNGCDP